MSEFTDFVWECARHFVEFDDPEHPLPTEFSPNPYYAECMAAGEMELNRFLTFTLEEARVEMEREYAIRLREFEYLNTEYQKSMARYKELRRQVRGWKPPTADHASLKVFMLEKLDEKYRWDFGPIRPEPVSDFDEWYEQRLLYLKNDLERRRKNYQDEFESCAKKTEWVRELKKSLEV